ncbi:MAG: TetR/AcrR family transcriptional regulator [Spirochaetales bacterium]|nr:TetR/AcrR family transcriptional regulator [Spirochaetales bacterium]
MTEESSTKELIREAAVDLFAAKGFKGASVRDIARRVGIKESSLYNHYKGKAAILESILEYQLEGINRAMLSREEMDAFAAGESDPVKLWLRGVAFYSSRLPRLTGKINRIIHNEMYLDEKCRRFFVDHILERQIDLTVILLGDLVDRGMIRECPLVQTAERYVFMLHGLAQISTIYEIDLKRDGDIQNRIVEHMASFIEGLT